MAAVCERVQASVGLGSNEVVAVSEEEKVEERALCHLLTVHHRAEVASLSHGWAVSAFITCISIKS